MVFHTMIFGAGEAYFTITGGYLSEGVQSIPEGGSFL